MPVTQKPNVTDCVRSRIHVSFHANLHTLLLSVRHEVPSGMTRPVHIPRTAPLAAPVTAQQLTVLAEALQQSRNTLVITGRLAPGGEVVLTWKICCWEASPAAVKEMVGHVCIERILAEHFRPAI